MRRRQDGGRRDDGDDSGKGFLSRWSERKRAAEEGILPEQSEDAKGPQAASGAAQEGAAGEVAAPVDPATLPDVDSLDADADFSAFMKEGVPRSLQRRALRRLWQVDPAFQEICMLDDYNLDYTDAAMVVPNLKTVYQVGKGMILGDEPEADADRSEEEADSGETASLPDETSAAAAEAPAPEEPPAVPAGTAAPTLPSLKTKARKPGDPIVSGSGTRRSDAAAGAKRSALRRRWGDAES